MMLSFCQHRCWDWISENTDTDTEYLLKLISKQQTYHQPILTPRTRVFAYIDNDTDTKLLPILISRMSICQYWHRYTRVFANTDSICQHLYWYWVSANHQHWYHKLWYLLIPKLILSICQYRCWYYNLDILLLLNLQLWLSADMYTENLLTLMLMQQHQQQVLNKSSFSLYINQRLVQCLFDRSGFFWNQIQLFWPVSDLSIRASPNHDQLCFLGLMGLRWWKTTSS